MMSHHNQVNRNGGSSRPVRDLEKGRITIQSGRIANTCVVEEASLAGMGSQFDLSNDEDREVDGLDDLGGLEKLEESTVDVKRVAFRQRSDVSLAVY